MSREALFQTFLRLAAIRVASVLIYGYKRLYVSGVTAVASGCVVACHPDCVNLNQSLGNAISPEAFYSFISSFFSLSSPPPPSVPLSSQVVLYCSRLFRAVLCLFC